MSLRLGVLACMEHSKQHRWSWAWPSWAGKDEPRRTYADLDVCAQCFPMLLFLAELNSRFQATSLNILLKHIQPQGWLCGAEILVWLWKILPIPYGTSHAEAKMAQPLGCLSSDLPSTTTSICWAIPISTVLPNRRVNTIFPASHFSETSLISYAFCILASIKYFVSSL